jgi:hypothetical protein
VPEAGLFPHQLIVVPVMMMAFVVVLMVMVLCPTSVHTFCPDAAMALEVSEVDRSKVMAGGVTPANLPQVFKNSRRSSSSVVGMTSTSWTFGPARRHIISATYQILNKLNRLNQSLTTCNECS